MPTTHPVLPATIVDQVAACAAVIVLPGYSRPLVRVVDYLELLKRSTYDGAGAMSSDPITTRLDHRRAELGRRVALIEAAGELDEPGGEIAFAALMDEMRHLRDGLPGCSLGTMLV
jgi:hypothetical protein